MTEAKIWLTEQSRFATSILHMGRYCDLWKATVNDLGCPSFHIVLQGICWLKIDKSKSMITLDEGDIVFFFKPVPFYIQSTSNINTENLPKKKMYPLNDSKPNDTALLCGILHPGDYKGELFFGLLPEYLILTKEMKTHKKFEQLIELLKLECWNTESECALTITRLTDVLLMYVVEAVIEQHSIDNNLLRIAKDEKLAKLSINIINRPSLKWSIDNMAAMLHISRSTFIRKVTSICGYGPNELVTRFRINTAKNLLRRGECLENISQKTGYESLTGFHKAFKKITSKTPGEYLKSISVKNT